MQATKQMKAANAAAGRGFLKCLPDRPIHRSAPACIQTRAAQREACSQHLHDYQHQQQPDVGLLQRRSMLLAGTCVVGMLGNGVARADDFTTSSSGLKFLDVRPGEGATPQPGDLVVVHWAGYTKGYQGKRIDNTSTRDEPYEFVLGSHEAIPAFEEAVSSMKVGGIRRVEVPGERPELSYPRDRSQRFTNELIPSKEGKIYKFRYGPQPVELGGQRALDFVLDNQTLNDLNRTLLFDIKLLAVRKRQA